MDNRLVFLWKNAVDRGNIVPVTGTGSGWQDQILQVMTHKDGDILSWDAPTALSRPMDIIARKPFLYFCLKVPLNVLNDARACVSTSLWLPNHGIPVAFRHFCTFHGTSSNKAQVVCGMFTYSCWINTGKWSNLYYPTPWWTKWVSSSLIPDTYLLFRKRSWCDER